MSAKNWLLFRRDQRKKTAAPHRYRRWCYRLASLLTLWGCYLFAWRTFQVYTAEKRIRAAELELDQTDPGWRLQEIEARRMADKPPVNSMDAILVVGGLLPKGWPNTVLTEHGKAPAFPREPNSLDLYEQVYGERPNRQLHQKLLEQLKSELQKLEAPLKESRNLKGVRPGLFTLKWSKDVLSTELPHQQTIQLLSHLLMLDAGYQLQQGHQEQALEIVSTLLDLGRAPGDEPFFVSMLVRFSCLSRSIDLLERILGQCEISAVDLAQLAQRLELEESELPSALQMAMRGERAGMIELLNSLAHGEAILEHLEDPGHQITLRDRVYSWFWVKPMILQGQTTTLNYLTGFVDLSPLSYAARKLPVNVLEKQIKLDLAAHSFETIDLLLMPAIPQALLSYENQLARLRCARLAIALERYRVDEGRWPAGLEALSPKYLTAIPEDPFDDEPLRLRNDAGRLTIYSLSADEQDDQGHLERAGKGFVGTDLGVQIWDVDQRSLSPDSPDIEIR